MKTILHQNKQIIVIYEVYLFFIMRRYSLFPFTARSEGNKIEEQKACMYTHA